MQVQIIVASLVDGEIDTKIHNGHADEAEIEKQQLADSENFSNEDDSNFNDSYIEDLWSRVNGSLHEDDGRLFLDAAVSGLYMSNAEIDEIGGVVYFVCDDHQSAVSLKS